MLAFDPPHGPFRLLYRHPVQEMPQSDWPRYEIALNPYTGAVQGKRLRGGGISFTRTEIMGTLLHFHANLWAGKTGRTIVGVIALLLLFSSLSGISLWWPGKGEWRRALSINRAAGRIRFHFDLHRVAGIGAAALLAVIAFTGSFFAFNAFYRGMIDPFSKTTLFDPPPKVESRQPHAPLAVAKVLAIAQQRYPGAAPQSLGLPELPNHVYTLTLRVREDINHHGGVRIIIDPWSGEVLRVRDRKRSNAGDTVLMWMFPLHSGQAFGTPGRILALITGLAPLLLFVTGVVIWQAKRRAKTLQLHPRCAADVHRLAGHQILKQPLAQRQRRN